MSAPPPVVTLGDAIIDAVQASGAAALYPGGAALNLAVGLARLGCASALAARIGSDRDGFRLMRYLREEGVRLINTPNADFTGVAMSQRRDGEPSYDFTPSLYRRRIAFNPTLLEAVAEAPAVAVNSFSYDDAAQAKALGDALDTAPGLKVLDPNPRPRLIADLDAFRKGFQRTARRSTLIKLSDEDALLLYGRDDDAVAESLFESGVETILYPRKIGRGRIYPLRPQCRIPGRAACGADCRHHGGGRRNARQRHRLHHHRGHASRRRGLEGLPGSGDGGSRSHMPLTRRRAGPLLPLRGMRGRGQTTDELRNPQPKPAARRSQSSPGASRLSPASPRGNPGGWQLRWADARMRVGDDPHVLLSTKPDPALRSALYVARIYRRGYALGLLSEALMSDWLSSYIAKRGVARGRVGKTRRLTEAAQGSDPICLWRLCRPVLTVAAGDVVVAEALDAFGGAIASIDDPSLAEAQMPFVDPQNGPDLGQGRRTGRHAVRADRQIVPRGPAGRPFGPDAGIRRSCRRRRHADAEPALPERVMKYGVTEKAFGSTDRIMLPFEPFIGLSASARRSKRCLRCSPIIAAATSTSPMSRRARSPTFPCKPRALISFSAIAMTGRAIVDCAASPSNTVDARIQIGHIKSSAIGWPRLETERFLMAIGSARPMEDAARIAYRELIRWLVADYGFEDIDAYFLLAPAGPMRVGDMVDSRYTLGASILKDACRSDEPDAKGNGNMDLGLKGLRAVVTGGSKGIGRRTANILAQEGASVAVCARNADEVEATVTALKSKGVDALSAAVERGGRRRGSKLVAGSGAPDHEWIAVLPSAERFSTCPAGRWRRLGGSRFDIDMMHHVRTMNAAPPRASRSRDVPRW